MGSRCLRLRSGLGYAGQQVLVYLLQARTQGDLPAPSWRPALAGSAVGIVTLSGFYLPLDLGCWYCTRRSIQAGTSAAPNRACSEPWAPRGATYGRPWLASLSYWALWPDRLELSLRF